MKKETEMKEMEEKYKKYLEKAKTVSGHLAMSACEMKLRKPSPE